MPGTAVRNNTYRRGDESPDSYLVFFKKFNIISLALTYIFLEFN